MALSGLDIFKLLPKTNCGECKLPTCLAFAMKLAGGQAKLEDCPHVSDEAKAALADAAAPPVRGVIIGQGAKEFTTGEELVLFRHEKRFMNPPGMGVLVSDAMSEDELKVKIEAVNADSWDRVGQHLEVKLVALKCESGDAGKFADFAGKVAGMTDCALMPMTEDAGVMKAALEKTPLTARMIQLPNVPIVSARGVMTRKKIAYRIDSTPTIIALNPPKRSKERFILLSLNYLKSHESR